MSEELRRELDEHRAVAAQMEALLPAIAVVADAIRTRSRVVDASSRSAMAGVPPTRSISSPSLSDAHDASGARFPRSRFRRTARPSRPSATTTASPMSSRARAGDLPTVASILAALRGGRAFVSASPRGPQLYLAPDPARRARVHIEARDGEGCALVLISDAGVIHSAAITSSVWDASVEIARGARYVRAYLVDGTSELRALTNPLWADHL